MLSKTAEYALAPPSGWVVIPISHNRLTILPNVRKCLGDTFTRYCRT